MTNDLLGHGGAAHHDARERRLPHVDPLAWHAHTPLQGVTS